MDKITDQINSYKFLIKDDDDDDEFEEINDCKYYSADSFRKAKFSTSNSFSVLHLNVHSIERHIDEIQVLLDHLKFDFDVLWFSESKIVDCTLPKININLEGYRRLEPFSTFNYDTHKN